MTEGHNSISNNMDVINYSINNNLLGFAKDWTKESDLKGENGLFSDPDPKKLNKHTKFALYYRGCQNFMIICITAFYIFIKAL